MNDRHPDTADILRYFDPGHGRLAAGAHVAESDAVWIRARLNAVIRA